MRLIDADAMKTDLKILSMKHKDDIMFLQAVEIMAHYIDQQPTITSDNDSGKR